MPEWLHALQRAQHIVQVERLCEHADRAVVHGLLQQILQAVGGHHHDLGLGLQLADLEKALDPVHARESHVHEGEVLVVAPELLDGGLSIEGQLDLVAVEPQKNSQAPSEIRVVVDDEYFQIAQFRCSSRGAESTKGRLSRQGRS